MSGFNVKRHLGNALALLLSVALIALSVEAYVRVVEDDGMQFDLEMWKYAKSVKRISDNPAIGHEHRPNADAALMGVRVTTNSAGFRGPEVALDKSAGTTRVMMLGDSVLFGWGARQDETVSARLQDGWTKSGQKIEVINTGVGNYNTGMEVEFFLTRGFRYKPDIVILNYFINDAEPTPKYNFSWMERISAAWVFYGSRLDIVTRSLEVAHQTDWKKYYLGLYDESRPGSGWTAAKDAIRKLAAYCKDNRIPLLIVNYPELHELKPYPFGPVSQRLEMLAKELQLPYLDLLPAVENEKPADLWVTPPDPHPNGRAHELYAAAIRAWIEKEGFLAQKR